MSQPHNELQIAARICQVLDDSVSLDARTTSSLAAARERALARQAIEPLAHRAWANNVNGRWSGMGPFFARGLIPALVLTAGLFALHSWQERQRAAEIEEIDAMLLSEDLPIDAYLDRGFEAWLKRRG